MAQKIKVAAGVSKSAAQIRRTARQVVGSIRRQVTGRGVSPGGGTEPVVVKDPGKIVDQPITPPDPWEMVPFTSETFPRTSDKLVLKVTGEGTSLNSGHIMRTPGAIRSRLTIEIPTPQHFAEPTVPRDVAVEETIRKLVPGDSSWLVIELRVGDHIPKTTAGILSLLQTHVLTHDSTLNLPAKVLLQPRDMVIADDVPIEPADAGDEDFRELWHFALRALTYPAPHAPLRSDETAWKVRQSSTEGKKFADRPTKAMPAVTDLENLVKQTGSGSANALLGKSLVLSGGGASGQLSGSWPKKMLTLYRERFQNGRTTTGMVAHDGILYPFGLAVSEVISWEREVKHPNGEPHEGAYLVASAKIVFSEMTKDLKSATSPFVRVDVVNPVRDGVPTTYGAEHDAFGHPIPLISYLVLDRAGVTHRLEAPGYFVRQAATQKDGVNPGTEAVERLLKLYAAVPDGPADQMSKQSPDLTQAFVGAHGARIAFRDGAATEASTLFTHSVRFRIIAPEGVKASSSIWYDTNRPDPEVDWFLAELSAVAEFTGTPVTAMMRYPRPDDPALLRPVEPIAAGLNRSVKSGAFGSPSFHINSITDRGAVFTPLPASEPAGTPLSAVTTAFPTTQPPKLLGLFDLKNFLPDAATNISPSIAAHTGQGETSGGERKLTYQTSLKTTEEHQGSGLLSISLESGAGSTFSLRSTIGADTTSESTVTHLTATLGGLIKVKIPECTIIQDGKGLRVKADVSPPQLTGQFSLVQEVLDALPPHLFGDGATVAVRGSAIVAEVVVDLPSVAFGIFAIRNLTFVVRVSFLLGGGGIAAEVSLGSADRPFQVGAGIFVGGGYFSLGILTDGKTVTPTISGAIELGAGVSIDLALASGVVQAVAGLTITSTKEPGKDTVVKAGGYVRVLGAIRVKYIGSMSLRAQVLLEFDGKKTISGTAKVSIEIDVFFLSTSFDVELSYSFKTNNSDPPLLELLQTTRGAETEWDDYWAAFGVLEEVSA